MQHDMNILCTVYLVGTLCTLCIGPNEVTFSGEIANAKMHLGFAFVVILPMVRPANLLFWSQTKHRNALNQMDLNTKI